jgi:glutamyl-tRNA reductase
VQLITLESVRMAAPEEQAESVQQAAEIVATAARSFEASQQARSVDSAIVALRKHTMEVLENELEKVRSQHGCTGPAQEVEFAMRRMVKQLLHLPTVRARELAANGEQDRYIAALEALYGITVEEPALPAAAEAASCPVAVVHDDDAATA